MKAVEKTKVNDKTKTKHSALLDGVLSNSSDHIQMLVQSTDPELIANTVAVLGRQPAAIHTFVRILCAPAGKHPYAARTALLWLSALLTAHYSLMSCSPDVTEVLRVLRDRLLVRTSRLERLSRLKGKVDLLVRSFDESAGAAPASERLQRLPNSSATLYQVEDSSCSSSEGEESEAVLRMAGKHFSDSDLDDEDEDEDEDEGLDVDGSDSDANLSETEDYDTNAAASAESLCSDEDDEEEEDEEEEKLLSGEDCDSNYCDADGCLPST